MITEPNQKVIDKIQRKVYEAERHSMALSLIAKHALRYSEDTSNLEDIKKGSIQENQDHETLLDFMSNSLLDLSKMMSKNYENFDEIR
jgi:ribosome maturation protein Sdo1